MFKDATTIIREVISAKDISFLMLTVSICLLPLSINLSTFTFILAIAFQLVQIILKRNKLFETRALKHSAIIGLLFFIYIQFNSIFQSSLEAHIAHFEKSYLHFALLPIAPALLKRSNLNKLLIYALFTGTVIALLVVFIAAVYSSSTYDKHAFTNVLDVHHTYLSMFILTLINYSIVKIITNKNIRDFRLKVLTIGLGIVLLLIMYLLDSKVGMLIFLILYMIHSLPELSKKNAWYYVSFLIIILIVLSAFLNKITVNYEKALDFRLQIWKVSFAEFESNPIFGNSKSSEKDILNYNHYIDGKYYFLDSDLNSHNQYLSILMKFGLIGFFILFLYAINIFNKISATSDRKDIIEAVGFFIIVLVISYIENILDRHHGIVYFTIFYNYYLVKVENAES